VVLETLTGIALRRSGQSACPQRSRDVDLNR
jgi:hypothetical protein